MSVAPPGTREVELVAIGVVRRARRRDGSLLVELNSGNADVLQAGSPVTIAGVSYVVDSVSPAAEPDFLVRLRGVESRDAAAHLSGQEIEIDAARLPVNPPGTYYHYEIIGASVQTADGRELGEVVSIMEAPGGDVYVVSRTDGQDGEALIPANRRVITGVDTERRVITIDPPKGLL